MIRCPGQDKRFWKPEDIFEVKCSECGGAVEFFKDEPKLKCRSCGKVVVNPKIDLGCAKWCRYAGQCTGVSAMEGPADAAEEKLKRVIDKTFKTSQGRKMASELFIKDEDKTE